MQIQLFQVPYDSGHKNLRAGLGPAYFIEGGLIQTLQKAGHDVTLESIEPDQAMPTEIGTAFELTRHLASSVASAVSNHAFPMVLAGNCNSCTGTLSGIDTDRLGIIWFDAHGDFNTPGPPVSHSSIIHRGESQVFFFLWLVVFVFVCNWF